MMGSLLCWIASIDFYQQSLHNFHVFFPIPDQVFLLYVFYVLGLCFMIFFFQENLLLHERKNYDCMTIG